MMGKAIEWLRDQWQGLVVVVGVSAIGGFAGSSPMVLWFYHGVCW